MQREILETVRTVEDKRFLTEEIEELAKCLYKKDQNAFNETLEIKVRARVARQIEQTLQEFKGEKSALLEEILQTLNSLRVLELTLAFEPTEVYLRNLSSWVREQVGEDVILDLKYDRNILGGAVVVFAGEERVFSIRKKLERLIEQEEEVVKL